MIRRTFFAAIGAAVAALFGKRSCRAWPEYVDTVGTDMFFQGRAFSPDTPAPGQPEFWMPDPPRDGDPVYCDGVRIGTFRGTPDQSVTADGVPVNNCWIDMVPRDQWPKILVKSVPPVEPV